jgi:hypothetical protein
VLKDSKGYKKLQAEHWMNAALAGLLAFVVICIIILSCVPPVSKDALIHHLAIPKLYLKQGGIYEIPWARWSYYPMNLDLLYMIPLYFGNDIIPKFIHFAFALLTSGLIFMYLKRRTNTVYALLGVITFLSLPIIVKLSITVYVDLGLVFFSTAALISLFKWIESGFKWKYVILSALCCGLALGTKYTGLIGLFLIALFIVFIHSKLAKSKTENQIKALGFGAAFIFVTLIVFSPWAIKNYLWTGNPIYPLYNNWFGARLEKGAPVLTGDQNGAENSISVTHSNKSRKGWSHFAVRKIVYKEKWWQTALIPIRIFFQGQDENPKYFDGKLNPFLFFFPFFAFMWIRGGPPGLKTEKKILLAFSILFILFAFAQRDMRIRYISPAIPPLVMLSIFGLSALITEITKRFSGFLGRIYAGIVFVIVSFLLFQNALYIVEQFRYVEPVNYISGRVGREEYIEKYRPEYAAIKFANQNLPPDVKILGVYLGNRSYYSERELIFAYPGYLLGTSDYKSSAQKISSNIIKNGITHMIIRYDLFENQVKNNYNENQRQTISRFLKNHLELLYSKAGYGLYRVRGDSG